MASVEKISIALPPEMVALLRVAGVANFTVTPVQPAYLVVSRA